MNNVILTGRLTKDPELRYTQNQMAVATFTLAVDRVGAKEKTADFIRIITFGRQAENCEKYLKKGRLCGVQGRIQTGSYKNKDGATVYTTDIAADRVEFYEWREKAEPVDEPPAGFEPVEVDDDIPF